MKKSFLVAFSGLLLFASCKEKAPVINFGEPVTVDTTFVLSPIPAAESHNVLVEEFTGQSCTNCPAAHETLNEITKAHPAGRINVIGIYFEGIAQTKPPTGAKYDLRHPHSKLIADAVFTGVSSIPSAGVDRVPVGANIKLDKGLWASNIETRLAVANPVNLKVESDYNTTDSMASVRVTMVYTALVDYPHNLSIAIVEDSIIDKQEYPSTDPVHPFHDDEYDFTNVFRGMITSAPAGDAVLTSITAKEPGRVIVKNYKRKVSNILNPAHCRVIAFVSSAKAGEFRVIQSSQVKMK